MSKLNKNPAPLAIVRFIQKLFLRRKKTVYAKTRHLEPKYWPQVRHFIETLNHLVSTDTIDDPNVQYVNQRIIEYIEEQINIKGAIADKEKRYSALDTLADRILAVHLSKIVGLKQNESTHAQFSEAVALFKKHLSERYQQEKE